MKQVGSEVRDEMANNLGLEQRKSHPAHAALSASRLTIDCGYSRGLQPSDNPWRFVTVAQMLYLANEDPGKDITMYSKCQGPPANVRRRLHP